MTLRYQIFCAVRNGLGSVDDWDFGERKRLRDAARKMYSAGLLTRKDGLYVVIPGVECGPDARGKHPGAVRWQRQGGINKAKRAKETPYPSRWAKTELERCWTGIAEVWA